METKKDEVSLFINGAEAFRISGDNYYAENLDDYDIFEEVSKEEFKRRLLEFKWIPSSWNKELRDQYKKMLEMVS